MKKDQVHIGRAYVAKVSGQLARVRIDAESRLGGWDATNVATGRRVRIKSAQRLRREVLSETAAAPAAAEATVVQDDRPPQAVDASRQAEAGQSEAADGSPYDPSRCATPRCKGTPVMTYLDRPLCQGCWDQVAAATEEEQPSEVSENACLPAGMAGDACRPNEEPQTPEEENAMSKKTKSKRRQSAGEQAKAQPAVAKAKGAKKAAATKTKAVSEKKPKRVSALDAAAQVLAKAGTPMRAQEMIAAMAEQGLWTSPGGKTPHATLYAAIIREIAVKGSEARFRKSERGQFESTGKGA